MASLDMTLDDMIKSRRSNDRGRGRGRPRRGRGASGSFRGGRPTAGAPRSGGPLGVNARPSAHTIAKSFRRAKNLPWQNGLFEDSLRAVGISSGLESGTKLYISNLDTGVTNEDIRELFSEIGELIRFAIHYDKNGRPSGSAEVVFARRTDAFQAFKKYNNVQLDGRPMKLEIGGADSQIPMLARVNVVGGTNRRRTVVMNAGQGPARTRNASAAPANWGSSQRGRGGIRGRGRGGGRGRGRGRGGQGQGQGQGRKKGVEKSADELDKELDKYHAEAMQT